ncbi:MAG: 2,3,4,5-tetrahydropyridine-2,6-dicarboxylate N-succinyltransferase, partial [Succinivibrionaceae bacterium]|nr:2,3,4,5-tetrahydropyridine-2,6-dicarboxylate N-succinyltransferase [Succinivibrionaceae bacterium]
MPEEVKEIIEAAWDQRAEITPDTASRELKSAVEEVINQLDAGQIRVAEK